MRGRKLLLLVVSAFFINNIGGVAGTDNDAKKLLKQIEKQFKCSLCTELLDDPKVLDCGHLGCAECMQAMKEDMSPTSSESDKGPCPSCKHSTKLDPTCLPTLHLLKDVIEKISTYKYSHRPICSSCQKKTDSKDLFHCKKCNSEKCGQLIELIERQLECPICTELLDDPKVLDCGHVCCAECIKGINRGPSHAQPASRKGPCPLCRTSTKLDPSCLPTLHLLKDVIEKIKTYNSSNNTTCSSCQKTICSKDLFDCKTCSSEKCVEMNDSYEASDSMPGQSSQSYNPGTQQHTNPMANRRRYGDGNLQSASFPPYGYNRQETNDTEPSGGRTVPARIRRNRTDQRNRRDRRNK